MTASEVHAEFDYSSLNPEDSPPFDMGPMDEPGSGDPLSWMDPRGQLPGSDELDVEPGFMKKPARAPGAIKYERKAADIITSFIASTTQKPGTMADAAALIMTGEAVAKATGDLAAHDDRVARGMDWMTEGLVNPYLAFGMAVAPLVIQLVRNHEPVFEPKQRKIGFRKFAIKVPFKFGIKLGILRHRSAEPEQLVINVFNDARVVKKLNDLGIPFVAVTGNGGRR